MGWRPRGAGAACADFFAALNAAAAASLRRRSMAPRMRANFRSSCKYVVPPGGIGAWTPQTPSMRCSAFGTIANYAVDDCECLLTLGARFDDRVAAASQICRPRQFIAHFASTPPKSTGQACELESRRLWRTLRGNGPANAAASAVVAWHGITAARDPCHELRSQQSLSAVPSSGKSTG